MNLKNLCVVSVFVFAHQSPLLFAEGNGPCMSTMDPPKSKKAASLRYVELKGVKWKTGQTIRIQFMGGTDEERQMVRDAASEWTQYANLTFEWYNSREELGGKNSDIRITFEKGKGSHSAVGTHATRYDQDDSTMNFGWNSKKTILHEFGHALGLKHEHQNPSAGIPWNKPLIYEYFAKQGWDEAKVNRSVFDELDVNTVNYSAYDDKSIMVYEFPPEWTTDGSSATRGDTLSAVDRIGIAKMYPGKKPGSGFTLTPVAPTPTATAETTEPAPTNVTPAAAPGTFSVGQAVQCGKFSGTVGRVLKGYITVKLSTGKLRVVANKQCMLAGEAPATPSAANKVAEEDDTVDCGSRSGKVVRTIGDMLLVDFAGGKRETVARTSCAVR